MQESSSENMLFDFSITKQRIIKTDELLNLMKDKDKTINSLKQRAEALNISLTKTSKALENIKVENEALKLKTPKLGNEECEKELLKWQQKYQELEEMYTCNVNESANKYQALAVKLELAKKTSESKIPSKETANQFQDILEYEKKIGRLEKQCESNESEIKSWSERYNVKLRTISELENKLKAAESRSKPPESPNKLNKTLRIEIERLKDELQDVKLEMEISSCLKEANTENCDTEEKLAAKISDLEQRLDIKTKNVKELQNQLCETKKHFERVLEQASRSSKPECRNKKIQADLDDEFTDFILNDFVAMPSPLTPINSAYHIGDTEEKAMCFNVACGPDEPCPKLASKSTQTHEEYYPSKAKDQHQDIKQLNSEAIQLSCLLSKRCKNAFCAYNPPLDLLRQVICNYAKIICSCGRADDTDAWSRNSLYLTHVRNILNNMLSSFEVMCEEAVFRHSKAREKPKEKPASKGRRRRAIQSDSEEERTAPPKRVCLQEFVAMTPPVEPDDIMRVDTPEISSGSCGSPFCHQEDSDREPLEPEKAAKPEEASESVSEPEKVSEPEEPPEPKKRGRPVKITKLDKFKTAVFAQRHRPLKIPKAQRNKRTKPPPASDVPAYSNSAESRMETLKKISEQRKSALAQRLKGTRPIRPQAEKRVFKKPVQRRKIIEAQQSQENTSSDDCPQSPPQDFCSDDAQCGTPIIIPLERNESFDLCGADLAPVVAVTGEQVEISVIVKDIALLDWDEEKMNSSAELLAKENPLEVLRAIFGEVSKETDAPLDGTHSPPAPHLTVLQQKLVTLFELTLKNSQQNDYLEQFLKIGKDKILVQKDVQILKNLTRFYVAVCQLHLQMNHLRLLCCDVIYYKGNLAVPFLYVITTMWNEVIPSMEFTDSLGLHLVKVIVQCMLTKSCPKVGGYNLGNLRIILSKVLGYPQDRWDASTMLEELVTAFKSDPSKMTEMSIILLCKSNNNKWTIERVESLLKPIVNENLRANEHLATRTVQLVQNLLRTFKSVADRKEADKILQWMGSLLKMTPPIADKLGDSIGACLPMFWSTI